MGHKRGKSREQTTLVATDGSKIRTAASKKSICYVNDLKQDRQQIQKQISNYLGQLDLSNEQERANLLKGDVGKTLRKLEIDSHEYIARVTAFGTRSRQAVSDDGASSLGYEKLIRCAWLQLAKRR